MTLDQLLVLARAGIAANVIGADLLSKALHQFQPENNLEAHLDAAEIALACRKADALQALRFRPWARKALEDAAVLLEGVGAACDIASALHRVASPAKEVSHAVHA
jgi:hypothetical protein